MKKYIHMCMFAVALLVCAASVFGGPVQSKFANTTDGTTAAVNFSGVDQGWTIKSAYIRVTTAGATTAQITFLERTGTARNPTTAPANGVTNILITNTGLAITNGNEVIYSYSDGADPTYATIISATATNVLLSTAITQTGTLNDRLYEIATNGVISIGTTAFNQDGPVMFATPSDSPLRVTVAPGTNITVTVTAAKE